MPQQTPIWHPIDKLPLIASLIDGQLESCQEQLQNLDPPGRKAPVLDDALVARIIRAYTEQQEMLPVFDEQLRRWEKAKPTPEQASEIHRLQLRLGRYQSVLQQILKLAREHEEFTVEQISGKNDAEVALDFFSGKMNRWL